MEYEHAFYQSSTVLPDNLSLDDYRHEYYKTNRNTGVVVDYTPSGGTDGTQPTFDGDPLFTGSYVLLGNAVNFEIQAAFTNITSFGTGQYYMTLPFDARYSYMLRDGGLHDAFASRVYHISGEVEAGSSQLLLYTTDRVGNRVYDFAFSYNEPIILTTADNFHISGTYIVDDTV
jgi:hypothetical protein